MPAAHEQGAGDSTPLLPPPASADGAGGPSPPAHNGHTLTDTTFVLDDGAAPAPPVVYSGCERREKLGAGSYGEVYKGWSPDHGWLAIKVCKSKGTDPDPTPFQRFEREIDILKGNWERLACLPKYFGDGYAADESRYYLMELLDGKTCTTGGARSTPPSRRSCSGSASN